MLKRGQITIFMIMGLVLVMIAGAIFIFNRVYIHDKLAVQNEEFLQTNGITLLIEQCVQTEGGKAIAYVSAQGGGVLPDTMGFYRVFYLFYSDLFSK